MQVGGPCPTRFLIVHLRKSLFEGMKECICQGKFAGGFEFRGNELDVKVMRIRKDLNLITPSLPNSATSAQSDVSGIFI